MEEFKIDHFKREYKDKEFPWFDTIDAKHSERIRRKLADRIDFEDYNDTLAFVYKVDEISKTIDGINAQDDNFDLRALLEKYWIIPKDTVYLDWYRFDTTDRIKFRDLAKYFDSIWYPGPDDIALFDDSLDWILSINHEGILDILIIHMEYKPEHADKALEILMRLLPYVKPRDEYSELIAILKEPTRWKEAHAHFSKIRVNITLPFESHKKENLDHYFVYIAECAAKTAYNCSGESAPFDNDSFEWLLKCEQKFLIELKKRESRSADGI